MKKTFTDLSGAFNDGYKLKPLWKMRPDEKIALTICALTLLCLGAAYYLTGDHQWQPPALLKALLATKHYGNH